MAHYNLHVPEHFLKHSKQRIKIQHCGLRASKILISQKCLVFSEKLFFILGLENCFINKLRVAVVLSSGAGMAWASKLCVGQAMTQLPPLLNSTDVTFISS